MISAADVRLNVINDDVLLKVCWSNVCFWIYLAVTPSFVGFILLSSKYLRNHESP